MLKFALAAVAVVALSGFTEKEAFEAIHGEWRGAKPDAAVAAKIDMEGRSLIALMGTTKIEGIIEQIDLVGDALTMKVGGKDVTFFLNSDDATRAQAVLSEYQILPVTIEKVR